MLCYHGDKICPQTNKTDRRTDKQNTGNALKTASVVVSATVGVYRMLFSHDDTKTVSQGKNNSSHAVAASKNLVKYSLVTS